MSEEHIKVYFDEILEVYSIVIQDIVIHAFDWSDGQSLTGINGVDLETSDDDILVYDSQEEPISDPIQPHLFDNLEIPTYTWSDDENTFLDDSSGLPYEVEGFILSLQSIVTGHTPLLVDDFKFKLWLTKQIED